MPQTPLIVADPRGGRGGGVGICPPPPAVRPVGFNYFSGTEKNLSTAEPLSNAQHEVSKFIYLEISLSLSSVLLRLK